MGYSNLKDLIQIAINKLYKSNENSAEIQTYEIGPIHDPLTWNIDDISCFHNAFNAFKTFDKSFSKNFSEKYLEKYFVSLMVEIRKSNDLSVDSLKPFIKKLNDLEVQKYNIIRELKGAECHTGNPLCLGPFIIFHKEIHFKHMFDKYNGFKGALPEQLGKFYQNVCISIEVSAKEPTKAIELADNLFDKFESISSFILDIMGGNKKSIGVFNFDNYKVSNCIILNENTFQVNSSASGAIEQVNLKTIKFDDENSGYDRLWNWLSQDKLTDIQSRIINAVIWTGKANNEKDISKAFIQYIIALESLLQHQKKNELVSPSITNRMAELSAFIIGQSLQDKIDIERKVKGLYGLRSQIAHGVDVEVTNTDINNAWWLLYSLIHIFLNEKPFINFEKIDDLNQWILTERYS